MAAKLKVFWDIKSQPTGIFCMLFCRLLIFFKIFWKKSFRYTIKVSNSLDLDQVGPELGPNCLQSLSADDTSIQRVTGLKYSCCRGIA